MTPSEMRHVLEAAYHSVFPGRSERELGSYEFGIAVGIVLGNMPDHEFVELDERDVKSIVKNLAGQATHSTELPS